MPQKRHFLAWPILLAAAAALADGDGDFPDLADAGAAEEVDAGRAAAFLDCEGLGPENGFWPIFRRAFAEQGPLGSDTMALAYHKWSEWEAYVNDIDSSGQFEGQITVPLPGIGYLNGTKVETRIWDRLDLIKALQRANFQALYAKPPYWGPDDLAGFLACPIGFVLVQYVIFLVHKVRSRLPLDDMKLNWESLMNSFGMVLGLPSYVFDHLESSSWGVTSFDMAVNMNTEQGTWSHSYEDYCRESPIPAARVASWPEDAPVLAAHVAEAGSLCPAESGDAKEATVVKVALLGEHGPTNLDHLSTAEAAVRQLCGGETVVEGAHFFTYLWNLEGTAEGSRLKQSLRLSWEAFWGEPLTVSQGRKVSGNGPSWTIDGAVQALRTWAPREPFLRKAGLAICCEPLWLCVLLHAANGGGRLLVRASMCLLHAFSHVFGGGELPRFWPLVRAFGEDMAQRGSLSAASRITAEMLAFQTGIRAPYVPALSLHVAAAAKYAPKRREILFFRSVLPSASAFQRLLQLLALEVPNSPGVVQMQRGASLSFGEMAAFRVVAMLPHVPYALRLSDVYAMGLPSLVPAQPLLHKFMWPHAGPFCGRTDPELSREVDEGGEGRTEPPFSPFAFQKEEMEPDLFHDDRRYWAQYSEWEVRPHLLRFSSARHLLQLAAELTEEEALAVSSRMLEQHKAITNVALAYWRLAASSASAVEGDR